MPFKCWIASLSRSDEYSSMTWARWAASETAARCPKGFHPHTHSAAALLLESALILGDRTIFTIFGSLHLLLSGPRTIAGCKQGINNAVKIFVDSQRRICKFPPDLMTISNEHVGEKILCLLMQCFCSFIWKKEKWADRAGKKNTFFLIGRNKCNQIWISYFRHRPPCGKDQQRVRRGESGGCKVIVLEARARQPGDSDHR